MYINHKVHTLFPAIIYLVHVLGFQPLSLTLFTTLSSLSAALPSITRMAIETSPHNVEYQSSDKGDMVQTASVKAGVIDDGVDLESREVFQSGANVLEFRTVSWQRAAIMFCKINFAMSILAIPEAISTVGAVGGSLILVGFTSLNVCKSQDQDRTLSSFVAP
jgi:hypothetical protein